MKKNLLFITSLIFSMYGFSQFTDANEPGIGEGTTLYVVDSMAPDYASVTGTGATWDYSNTKGYDGEARNLTLQAAQDAPNGANFPNSSKALNIENFLVSYFDSDANERTVQGFVFTEPTIQEVIVEYDDDLQTYDYPFGFDDEIVEGNVEGSATATLGTFDIEGEASFKVDGEGTLLLANGVTHTNVLRYKTEEDYLAENIPLIGDVTINRVQYEYYDLNDNNLPIFVHSTIVTSLTPDPIVLVMSIEDPTELVSTQELTKDQVNIFPNPVEGELKVNLANNEMANITITDALGKVVHSQRLEHQNNTVSTADFTNGIYFVKVNQNNQVYTQKIIKK